MQEIEQLLRTTMGLDAASIGPTEIARAVRQRMRALDLRELAAYHAQLGICHAGHEEKASALPALAGKQKSAWQMAELQELIETVVVTETWFFRDVGAFRALARLAATGNWPAGGGGDTKACTADARRCRILSLPCSTGEEPYSIAMTLLDAGLREFHIDAVDISARALARAERGVYTRNSFRGRDLAYRDRYFNRHAGVICHAGPGGRTKPAWQMPEAYELEPIVRQSVQFHQRNLLDPLDDLPPGRYDFVFFRNLLIYLDRPAQERALARVGEHLSPHGVCFVGAAELPLMLNHGYVNANLAMAFACRRAPLGDVTTAAVDKRPARSRRTTLPFPPLPTGELKDERRESRASRGVESLQPWTLDPRLRSTGGGPAAPQRAVRSAGDVDLASAQRLADQGQLGEAAALCDMHLKVHGPSVPAFYLLGLIKDAQASPQAIEYYRKALYLDPKHEDSLHQLALITERDGDKENARNLRRRVSQRRDATA